MFRLEKKSDKAILTIYGYVGGSYLEFRKVEDALFDIRNSGIKQLDLWMHTYGGDVIEGNLIDNFLTEFCKSGGEIDLYMPGVMASMGSIIMTSATRRHIADNGFVMIHSPKGGIYGTAKDMDQTAKLLRSMEKNFTNRLISITGKSEKEVKQWFDGTDYWFDADECIQLGLANDKIGRQVNDIKTLEKTEVIQIGAKAAFERFAALHDSTPITKTTDMDKKTMIARYGLTSVTEANTDEEIMAAIDAKIKTSNDAAASAKAELAKTQKTSIEASVDAAISAGKITKEKRGEYIARGEKIGLEELNAIFADMQIYQPITGQIRGGNPPQGSGNPDRKGWDWNRYQKEAKAELEAMPEKDPETFKALYKAEYGVEPQL